MEGTVDFFVSYTSADRPWAEWIAWELEAAGYSTVVQAWDIRPGSNFVLEMHQAVQVAERTIAVLSPAFLHSPYCSAEWAAAFARDPTGSERKLVPVRVRECDPGGLVGQVAYVDLAGLEDGDAAAREALLDGVAAGRAKPASRPAFPGNAGIVSARVRRPDAGAAIFNVPVMTRTFVGRQEPLERLASGLSDSGAVAITQVQAIHGMGGVGKSQLAAQYARVHRDAYDVVWWLRAEQSETLREDLAQLAVALGLVDASDVGQHEAVTAARMWLARSDRWLLVFDNAIDPEAIANVLPEGTEGHVLITSRAHADWRALRATPLALDVWERPESLDFLIQRTDECDTEILDALAAALGDLPLALEQAAAYTNKQAITLANYLERLRDRPPDLFAAGKPPSYEHTIATVWNLSFERIAKNPLAAMVLSTCACLAPERIPRELFEAWADDPDAGDAKSVDEAIELLLAYALLTVADEQSLNMHRLIQQVARIRDTRETRKQAAAAAIFLLERVLPQAPWEHEHWPLCQRLLPHVLAAADHVQALSSDHPETLNPDLEATATVLGRLGQYEHAAGAEFASARELSARALTILERVFGSEHPQVAAALVNLGIMLLQTGDLAEARAALERALTIRENVFGQKSQEVAETLVNLGIVLREEGNLAAARGAQERALAILEGAHGHEHPHVAKALDNLGSVLEKLGDLGAARAALERALAIDEKTYGPEHPEIAVTLGNLALVLEQLRDLPAALAAHERALTIKEKVYGPEHPQVAGALGNLGIVLRDAGNLKAARPAFERALAILEGIHGSDHPDVVKARGNLGTVFELESFLDQVVDSMRDKRA